MSAGAAQPGVVDRIKRSLVGLKMPMALEIVDATLRRIERGEVSALEAIDLLLAEELTLRETRRVRTALVMARLSAVKTLAEFDFSFQPTLDRNRVLALAELKFVACSEVLHFLGPPGTGKSHLAVALGVEAVRAGYSVYFSPLADLVGALAKAEREGSLRQKIKFFCRFSLLIVDEIGYLPLISGGGNLFVQLVNARYERGAMILTSNRGFAEWGDSSTMLSWPRRCWTDFFITPSWCRSKDPATGGVSTTTSCPITSGPGRSPNPQSSRPQSDAGGRRRTGAPITSPADHPSRTGEDFRPRSGEIQSPLTRASIGRCLTLYNGRRPHSSLDRKTPDQAYFDRLPQIAAA